MQTITETRYIWCEEDIKGGLYIIRNSSPKGSENLSFARTVTFKIGYNFALKDSKYGLISCLTDGYFHPVGNKKAIVNHLNTDRWGYRPLTKEEYIEMINNSNQGFFQEYL